MHVRNWIRVVVAEFEEWREQSAMTKEDAAQAVVDAFHARNGEAITGLVFEVPGRGRDVFTVRHTNAVRLYRWFDCTKPNNHLPAVMIPFVIAAMAPAYQRRVFDKFSAPFSLAVHAYAAEAQPLNVQQSLSEVMREDAESHQALVALLDGATEQELRTAQRELTQALDAKQQLLNQIEATLRGEVINLNAYLKHGAAER